MTREDADALAGGQDIAAHSDELCGAAQHTLAALADVETHYESELLALSQWSGPEKVKLRLAAELAENRRKAREIYMERLGEIQRRMLAGTRTLH